MSELSCFVSPSSTRYAFVMCFSLTKQSVRKTTLFEFAVPFLCVNACMQDEVHNYLNVGVFAITNYTHGEKITSPARWLHCHTPEVWRGFGKRTAICAHAENCHASPDPSRSRSWSSTYSFN